MGFPYFFETLCFLLAGGPQGRPQARGAPALPQFPHAQSKDEATPWEGTNPSAARALHQGCRSPTLPLPDGRPDPAGARGCAHAGEKLNRAERVGGGLPLGARRQALPSHQTSRRLAGGRSASFVSWHMPAVMEGERRGGGREAGSSRRLSLP